mmetsp:Transcript_84963/g.188794  ORF Transcript_84963/g.188794 Transcript_84963/m.188794 type:complete len:296 (+) Transcript_84963:477-1364(+)
MELTKFLTRGRCKLRVDGMLHDDPALFCQMGDIITAAGRFSPALAPNRRRLSKECRIIGQERSHEEVICSRRALSGKALSDRTVQGLISTFFKNLLCIFFAQNTTTHKHLLSDSCHPTGRNIMTHLPPRHAKRFVPQASLRSLGGIAAITNPLPDRRVPHKMTSFTVYLRHCPIACKHSSLGVSRKEVNAFLASWIIMSLPYRSLGCAQCCRVVAFTHSTHVCNRSSILGKRLGGALSYDLITISISISQLLHHFQEHGRIHTDSIELPEIIELESLQKVCTEAHLISTFVLQIS